ncbi:MAG: hypothetical protein JO347_11795 [Candidatus Eremiobacteraeota bacterium]|nr:hypothetical protein [Candidatus Eremiobacteraeota bacterium]
MLVGNYEVDNRTGEGIPELKNAIRIEAARLPQMGSMLSIRWLRARLELAKLSEAQTSRTSFDAICQKERLTPQEADTLIDLLHDLGTVIYYGRDEGLRDVIVLQPEWLTTAIGYVLEDREVVKAKGELEHKRLHFIWNTHYEPNRVSYDDFYHPYFLRLMEKFDISYRLPTESRSLVAELVPKVRPDLPWQSESQMGLTQRELALTCVMNDEPPGLIAWLTVRNHRFSTGRHWTRGVFLAHQGCEALIEMDGILRLTVRGPSPDYFFSILRDSLEYLIELRWPGLEYEFQVPCSRESVIERRCRGRFAFQNLVRAREQGIGSVQCHECFRQRDVGELLTGFAATPDVVGKKLDEVIRLQIETITLQGEMAEAQNRGAAEIRNILAALSSENRDCPHLFSIIQKHQPLWRVWGGPQYQVQLFCEQPEQQHPVEGGYTIEQPLEWLRKIAPYAALVLKVLKLAVPFAAPVVEMTLEESTAKSLKPRLDVMEKLLNDLPTIPTQFASSSSRGLTTVEGAGLRGFYEFLKTIDPERVWGNLRRVETTSRDVLWVCPAHYREYDPGLPVLPEPAWLE